MQCPKCQIELEPFTYKQIPVDRCPSCEGMWFDYEELDMLEDKEFAMDDLKGSLIHREQETDMKCPRCGKPMRRFQYRLYSLELEYCVEGHGFWLDKGEEQRVLAIMSQREKDMERKFKAEDEWNKMLKRFRNRTFFDRLRNLLNL